ncbi:MULTISPECIES: alpha/beta fold hydrolase [Saccharothrix]|uniref:alpha/beta fold hydrolase n=1 Tax=Saccharothrix TaxID=2071 RepID=UPI00093A0B76|nr:alpha/beta fold hydrolase [Saccharothrix sp. CB00851]OKI17531.1 hypothetical protein A6A25_40770 [Saccharothrix sp. CB00851]
MESSTDRTAVGGRATVLLVHGAWVTASSWSRVARALNRAGYDARAVQLPELDYAQDVAVVRRAVEDVGRTVVLVGHSYGGAVISAAAAGKALVKALVYVAAFAPAPDETIADQLAVFPALPSAEHLRCDPVTRSVTLEPDAFLAYFAPDLPRTEARALAGAQPALAVGATTAKAVNEFGEGGAWSTVPCWYAVSDDDKIIDPRLQVRLAERMRARQVVHLRSGHASPMSHPHEVAGLIRDAVDASAA